MSERPSLDAAASMQATEVLTALGTSQTGLTSAEAAARLAADGPNAVRTHHASLWRTLIGQFRSPLLLLLLAAALVSALVGEAADALIIAVIVTASVGLGTANEFRADRAAEALHAEIRHEVSTLRDGAPVDVDATQLVPGDVVSLGIGAIVPADLRIISARDLECDESILTGESLPVDKSAEPTTSASPTDGPSPTLFMGTVVHRGTAQAVVVATGAGTRFGAIALGLGERHAPTEFEIGLTRFSGLLAKVAGVLSIAIFVINVALGRPLIDAVLFSLAIAVGITPQLLPAVVSTSLATGAHRLAQRKVLVKRLVSIEDLGDIDVLFSDKTGTVTEGKITFERAVDPDGRASDSVMNRGLLCTDAMVSGVGGGGGPLDEALRDAVATPTDDAHVLDIVPFDHDRRRTTVLVEDHGERRLITKGAPESVLELCHGVADATRDFLMREFERGVRVVAVASRPADGVEAIGAGDEDGLTLDGFLVFLDPPKASAAASVERLAELGLRVKIVTGDNAVVAASVCGSLGIPADRVLTGDDLDGMDDAALDAQVDAVSIFARVSPEQKARILRAQRDAGSAVAFLGDGVNDALALHHADVGISVDTAVDVAKDAADIILLEHDLDVLADGIVEGRRTFANTIKYVRMGTSSNFGNMFSVTIAAAFLPFLPMLPSQILLNNLLYDVSQLTIPTDHVDEEQLVRPSHWDIRSIRRFMFRFGPISSVFDIATFVVLLRVLHASAPEFRTGWFIESLATQTVVVFAIRTLRVPFFRSRPSLPLAASAAGVLAVGVWITRSPLASTLGFAALPGTFYAVVAGFIVAYIVAVDLAKLAFFRAPETRKTPLRRSAEHRLRRLAAPWRHHTGAAEHAPAA
jgi:P-type Mg2+ transporter